jgi:branched-chain amino acid aminotransferase
MRALDGGFHGIGRYHPGAIRQESGRDHWGISPGPVTLGAVPILVNLGGTIVPPADAKVSVFDRGFLYGDSVYEVLRTYGGRPFEVGPHLARLAHSAERIGLVLPWDAARTTAELERTLAAEDALRRAGQDHAVERQPGDETPAPWNAGERYVRVVMTRGAGELGLDPSLAVNPVALVIVMPLQAPPARAYAEGVKVAIVGVQQPAPQAVDPTAKTGAHLPHVLAVREARAAGAHEALLLDARGFVTEGSSSNVFAVRDGVVRTPPLAAGILAGVTRGVVIALARAEGVTLEEVPLRPSDLEGADEVFLTSTMREILPVTRVGDRAVGAGRPGPVTYRLHQAFRRLAGGPARLSRPDAIPRGADT